MKKMEPLCVPRLVDTLICDDGVHMIDIVEEENHLACWIYRKNYPLKIHMFGVPKTTMLQYGISFEFFVYLINKILANNGEKYKKQLSGVARN